VPELPDLRARLVGRDALGEVALGDLVGGGRHARERPQPEADEEGRREPHDEERDERDDQEHAVEAADRVVDVLERAGDRDVLACRGGDDP
jgi:hypothetical protein